MNAKEILEAYKAGQLSLEAVKEKLLALETQLSQSPLSEGQKGLWLLQKTAPAMSAYNVPVCLRITNELNPEMLKQACCHVLKQNPVLTSVFREENGNPYQLMQPSQPMFFQQEDLSAASWDEVLAYLKGKAKEPFSLEDGPLMRIYLITRSEQEQLLLINIHHIIFDGTSIMLFIQNLLEAYKCLKQGRPLKLHSQPATYKDFVEWEQQMLNGPSGTEHRAYWQKQLSGDLPVIELPADQPRVSGQGFRGKTHISYIPQEVAKKIKEYAKASRVSPSMFFMGIFKTFLYRYTGQKDIIVGMPTRGRPEDRFETLIGYFINMVPVRSQVVEDAPFSQFAQDLQMTLADAIEHAEYPFPVLVRDLLVDRNKVNAPVFQIVFAYQNFIRVANLNQFQEQYYEALSIEQVEEIRQEGEFEFQLEVFEQESGFKLLMKYNPDIFNDATIIQMMQQYKVLAEDVVNNQVLTVGELAAKMEFGEADQKLLEEYNRTDEVIVPTTLQQLFVEQYKRTPDKIAIVSDKESITYRELHEKSNQVAGYLQALGLQSNQFVGVLVHRCIDTIINTLGILKAGAAYVPIEPEYPEERRQYILQNSNCKLVLNPVDYRDKNMAEYPVELADNNEYCPDDIAYVIYTSGSTGRPKGVVIAHKAVTNTIIDINQKFGVSEDDRIIGVSSMCFDLSVYDIFGALSTGAQLVLVSDQKDMAELEKIVMERKITIWNTVPAIMNLLVDNLPVGVTSSSLRLVMLSGDWIPLKLPGKIKEHFACATVISLGGATEASIWSIYYPITEVREAWKSIPYGRPLANQKYYVLNSQLQPCFVNVPGELFIGGVGVAEGYMNDAEKTKNSFIQHPQFGYIYRTGDHGVMRKEGYIEFLGRKDFQVKIRGYRIELGEIENQLLKHSAIKEAVVIDCMDANKNKYLCAYIVAERELAVAEIRESLAQALPDYMIPTQFVQLAKIPLTANGKVDRRALPKPDENTRTETPYVAPRNNAEKKMVKIWQHVLGVERVSIEDNYLELGGYSVNAIALASAVQREFGVKVAYSQVFRAPTLKEFVAGIVGMGEYDKAEAEFITFNEQTGTKSSMFCLPALVPSGLVYRHLAGILKNHSFYCFDLIQSERRSQEYADAIIGIQPAGPYIIAGYSVGGFLAFEVAKELEYRGHKVGGVILIDSSYLVEHIESADHEKLVNEAREVLDKHIDNFMDFTNVTFQEKQVMKQELMNKAENYLHYYYGTINNQQVAFDIHLIKPGEDAYKDFPEEFSRKFSQEWDKKTTGCFVQHEGYGSHLFMMEPGFIKENAKVAAQILQIIDASGMRMYG